MIEQHDPKPHDARNVANDFIRRGIDSEKPFDPLQIQKLTFFAHGYMLGIYGHPLVEDTYEAWKHGPVAPSVYYGLSYYGSSPVTEPLRLHPSDDRALSPIQLRVVDIVIDEYAHLSGWAMRNLTHRKGAPWRQVSDEQGWFIPNGLIRRYYHNVVRGIGEDTKWKMPRIRKTRLLKNLKRKGSVARHLRRLR